MRELEFCTNQGNPHPALSLVKGEASKSECDGISPRLRYSIPTCA